MELPQLVREKLGEDSPEATVTLGDEDFVCLTPTRTIVYRGEGLLSDESVTVFPHDVERLNVSEGRRKTKFVFEYVEGTETLTVPESQAAAVLELILAGMLHVDGVTGDEETVEGVFTFSELTLVVTSERLVKHVGRVVWDDDYEEYPYADVTGLSFEEGSVATQIVLAVEGRPERIKAPSDEARLVEQTLTAALFAFHDVDSLAELNELLGSDEDDRQDDSASLSLEDGISPLVGEDDPSSDPDPVSSGESPDLSTADDLTATESAATDSTVDGPAATDSTAEDTTDEPTARTDDGPGTASAASGGSETSIPAETTAVESVDPAEIEAIKQQLSTLTEAVQRQNELLRTQQETVDAQTETVEKLIEELRRGR